jgi:GT2 family glycosyltransferase
MPSGLGWPLRFPWKSRELAPHTLYSLLGMRLAVVLVNWNSNDDLRACLSSLRRQTHADLQIIVVDNGSSDGSADMVRREFGEALLLAEGENLGFAEACNRGIAASTTEWVAMLNNDTLAEPEWAAALVEAAEAAPATCGMLQSSLLYLTRPDTINSTGIELTTTGGGRDRDEGKRATPDSPQQEIFCPTAGAAAYRRSMLDAIRLPSGYFDRDHFMYYEDLDLGWRARLAGWSALHVPRSVVLHRWHGSSERHGKAWLIAIAGTNRMRTLLKNASLAFLAATFLHSLEQAWKVFRYGGLSGLAGLWRASLVSVAARSKVSAMARRSRRALERQWVVRSF